MLVFLPLVVKRTQTKGKKALGKELQNLITKNQMEDLNLDEQLKAAERDKYIAEAKKAASERSKIDFEHTKLKKIWWKKITFRQFIEILIGISFLTFYINYV